MRLLLDTHMVLAIVNNTTDELPAKHAALLQSSSATMTCSVASLWEIAIGH